MARKSKKNDTLVQNAQAQIEPTSEEMAVLDATLPAAETVDEAIESIAVQADEAVVQEDEAPTPSEPVADFAELTKAIEADAITAKMKDISDAIKDREAFEDEKADTTGKMNIFRTLKNLRRDLVRAHAARVLIATNVSVGFINRELHDGSRYNVYALGKLGDLVDALTGNTMSNAINIAIVRTMFAFKKAGKTFTKEVALAAASDKLLRTVAPSDRGLIVSHSVSAVTAPTQASSTLQALATLGIVKVSGGSRKNPTYEILVNPQSAALEEVAEALAA